MSKLILVRLVIASRKCSFSRLLSISLKLFTLCHGLEGSSLALRCKDMFGVSGCDMLHKSYTYLLMIIGTSSCTVLEHLCTQAKCQDPTEHDSNLSGKYKLYALPSLYRAIPVAIGEQWIFSIVARKLPIKWRSNYDQDPKITLDHDRNCCRRKGKL